MMLAIVLCIPRCSTFLNAVDVRTRSMGLNNGKDKHHHNRSTFSRRTRKCGMQHVRNHANGAHFGHAQKQSRVTDILCEISASI